MLFHGQYYCIRSISTHNAIQPILHSIFRTSVTKAFTRSVILLDCQGRAVTRALIGGGGIFIYLCFTQRISYEITKILAIQFIETDGQRFLSLFCVSREKNRIVTIR